MRAQHERTLSWGAFEPLCHVELSSTFKVVFVIYAELRQVFRISRCEQPKTQARAQASRQALHSGDATQVGDKVIPQGSELVFEITKIHGDGELTFNAPGTVLHRFRVDPATVKFVDQPRSLVRPSRLTESQLDAAAVLKRVTTIQA
jgi:hypothetical protein